MKDKTIIIIAAKQIDIDDCSALICDEFSSIYSCTNIPDLRELLEVHKSSILLFNHGTLQQSFTFYQNLFHKRKKPQNSLISTVLLCKALDADSAYKLVNKKVFDDYVIFKPVYDPHRLCLTLHSLNRECSIAANYKVLEQQLKDLAGKANVLHSALGEIMSLSNDKQGKVDKRNSIKIVPTQLQAREDLDHEVLQQRIDGVVVGVTNLDQTAMRLGAVGKKILIVDEDDIYSHTLQSILEEIGYNVRCESGGETGLKRMATLQPDHVLIDCNFPDMSGLNFLEKVKVSNLLQHIPITLLTSNTDLKILNKIISAGACGYIAKPANRETISLYLRGEAAPSTEVCSSQRGLEFMSAMP